MNLPFKLKQNYASIRFSMAAGLTHKVSIAAEVFEILSNNLSTNAFVSIEGGPYYELPSGVIVKTPEGFKYLEFRNPSAASMTLFVCLTTGAIDDARAVFAEEIQVQDVSTAISTPASSKALDLSGWLIDAAAAVDKGGGKVGIPVTGQPFSVGETVIISGTVNYNGAYYVDGTSSANEIVITKAYVAETFDGVDDKTAPNAPRSIAADSTRKELIVTNHSSTKNIYVGDVNIAPASNRGIPIPPKTSIFLDLNSAIYYAAESGTGVAGCIISWANLIKS